MINTIANTEDKKRLLSNFVSLSVLQGANFILPLITIPYLVRVLGVENFGLLAFATATIIYFNLITDYGFNLTATRDVSIYRDDKEKVIEIFSSVMTIKFILMLLSFFLMSIIIFSFEKLAKDWLIYFLTFGTVIGQMLFPIWLFQGMEKMKYITYLNILAKSIFTIAIFIFVHDEEDIYWVPILTALGFIVAGIYSLIIAKKDFSIGFKLQSIDTLKFYFLNGWDIFVSQIGINLYRSTNILILGVFSNNTYVGYYAIADKLLVALQSLQVPIGQALFPFISRKFAILNKNDSIKILLNQSYLVIAFYIFIVILAFLFAPYIILLVVGALNQKILLDFYILIPVVLIGGLNYYFGVLGLTNLGLALYFSRAVLLVGVINLILSSILSILYNDIGTAISLLSSESILLFILLLIILKQRNKI